MTDASQRFLFDDADVRGEVVRLDSVVAEAVAGHAYPPAIARLLGQALAATALLRATIRLDGVLTLQVQGEEDAPVSLLIVHAEADGALRGTVSYRDVPDGEPGLARLCGHGRLAITIEPEEGERYQGIVGIDEAGLAATLEAYFERSEQLPTHVHLASDGERAGGMLLQRLPASGRGGEDPDAWERVGHLAATLEAAELLERSATEILHRLFHQEAVRVFEPWALRFECRCSAERIAAILRGLGREEVEQVLAEQGVVEVRCEFCGALYRYDRVDVEHALAGGAAPGSAQYH
ncbi:Hsp33 family molecular chaperone HslO [Halorhodospira neutriphila]|uniref:33 kDa chaperonin n=1 Tax=Halorhodospira neutriphila TaxID=168379 RepID=A0ABS1E5T8_9GAMM|nr:redox-regulated molecular chaperone Hsp33 [Halorhodospira neutriphila]